MATLFNEISIFLRTDPNHNIGTIGFEPGFDSPQKGKVPVRTSSHSSMTTCSSVTVTGRELLLDDCLDAMLVEVGTSY